LLKLLQLLLVNNLLLSERLLEGNLTPRSAAAVKLRPGRRDRNWRVWHMH